MWHLPDPDSITQSALLTVQWIQLTSTVLLLYSRFESLCAGQCERPKAKAQKQKRAITALVARHAKTETNKEWSKK